jgi:hypothetical protein
LVKLIKVRKSDRVLHVTEKAFNVVYSGFGYSKVEEVAKPTPDEQEQQTEAVEEQTELEEKKVKKPASKKK